MMSFNIHPSNNMEYSLDRKKISSKRQSRSKNAKGSSVLPQNKPCPRYPDTGSPSSSSTQRDELVKYMSTLPDYLKHSYRGESIQEKALNFGVLDWSRLEKWKNKQSHRGESSSSAAAITSSTLVGSHKKLDDRRGSHPSRIRRSHTESLPKSSKLSSQNVKQYQHSDTELRTLGEELGMRPSDFTSNSKIESETSLQKEKRNCYDETTPIVGDFASKSRHHGVSDVAYESSNGKSVEIKMSMRGLQRQRLKKKERNINFNFDKGLPSLEPKNKGVSFESRKKMSSSISEANRKMHQWQESDIGVHPNQYLRIPSNIVLLRPRKFLQSSSEDYFQNSQSRTSSDGEFSDSSQTSLSYVSLPEEVPHSSVLPSVTELASSSSSETIQHNLKTYPDIDHSSVLSKKISCSNEMSSPQSEDSCNEKGVSNIKLRNQKESQDHETSNRWINFSLNKIGRSFSFKEDSSLQKHSSMSVSTKSGPLTSEYSASFDNIKKDKVKGHNRTRSSPMLRFLDPLLNIHHSSEHSLATKGSMASINFNAEKSKESSIQALLQLTIKNGQPLFKFVLNSERKVLAATMTNVASAAKDGVGCYFTFYHVNEIKRKSGKWMSHWSKEKNCGYAYNIVGQMKVCGSKIIESSNQNSETLSMVKEYVLFGAENQELSKFFKRRELAAIVIEIPCENVIDEGLLSHNLLKKECLNCLEDERCFCSSQDNDITCNTRVILPGGVHGSPNKGEPSSLINRWKFGGLCDCGGWDVGCKLLVLSNQNLNPNVPRSLRSYLEGFQLFVQEGADQNTPLFTMKPMKDGFYSVEFNSRINHLQAFFICVSVLSSQKLCPLGMNDMQEDMSKELSFKNNNELQEKAPINYNPIPPLSPVDRV